MNQAKKKRGFLAGLRDSRGVTLIELLIAAGILSTVVSTLLVVRSYMSRQTLVAKEKTFSAQRAMSMMEELRQLVSGQETEGILVLDDYDQPAVDDGAAPVAQRFSPMLTTLPDVTDPLNPVSGNVRYGQAVKYLRNIQVEAVEGDEQSSTRRVTIRIYRCNRFNSSLPEDVGKPIVEVATILQTLPRVYFPSQMYDVYVIVIENVAGWWTAVDKMRATVDEVIKDTELRNPGLKFRVHLITRNAYGRDLEYVPFINKAQPAANTSIPGVYFYPGMVIDANNEEYYFFRPEFIKGRMNLDGSISGTTDFPLKNYSLADNFNHAVRYPEEKRLYEQAKAVALSTGEEPPEPSLRMILEEMSDPTTSAKYKNALFMNLHGEMLPLPPMRNYSDAAKDPVDLPDRRIVTHPTNLRVDSGDPVTLRVYPYLIYPDNHATTSTLPETTIWMPGLNYVSPTQIEVTRITGNSTTAYSSDTAPVYSVPTSDMVYSAAVTTIDGENGVLLTLYNSPLRHAAYVVGASTNGGITPTYRLYGLEYVPCAPAGTAPAFPSYDLTASGNQAKNTARWQIALNASLFAATGGEYRFETRIGSDVTTGTLANKPPNLSRTYVWVGMDPPVTEQYQYMGDPRWCPYLDVKASHRYNWYFRDVHGLNTFTNFNRTDNVNGWGQDAIEFDVPRFYQTYRNALLGCQAVWSTLNGMSYYYCAFGGEFGGDNTPLNTGVTVNSRPYLRTGTPGPVRVDEIYPWLSCSYSRSQLISDTNSPSLWVALPWIGELYPDSVYATQWHVNGNLNAGPGGYYRKHMNQEWYRQTVGGTAYSIGALGRSPTKRAFEHGATTFMNNAGSTYFRHLGDNAAQGVLQTLGTNTMRVFKFPLLTTISANRPFYFSSTSTHKPTHWDRVEYSGTRCDLTWSAADTFYNSSLGSSYKSSAIMTLHTSSPARTSYINVSGLNTQGSFGRTQMGQFTLMGMLMAYLNAGLKSDEYHIVQLPKIDIRSPLVNQMTTTSPLPITWRMAWEKWGDRSERYTDDYPDPYFTDSTTALAYVPLFKQGVGGEWRYMKAPAEAAQEGVLPPASYRLSSGEFSYDSGTKMFTYNWDNSSMVDDTYVIRIELYRTDFSLHYSYDTTQFMKR